MVEDPVILRGLSIAGGGNAPTILERTDQEFIPALLEELASDGGLQKVAASLANERDPAGRLKLFQPVHRTFHVAMVEVACDTIGRPRLDPSKIESAGLVVRRVISGNGNRSSASKGLEAWVQSGKRLRGWSEFTLEEDQEMDPDPLRRPPKLKSGNTEINRLLTIWKQSPQPLSEAITPLFVAPPEVCRKVKRTVLYGVVPVTSSEVSEPVSSAKPTEQPSGLPQYDTEKLRAHLPFYLQQTKSNLIPIVPRAEDTLTFANADDPDLANFVLSLRQLKFEFDAFGEGTEGKMLFQELNKLSTDPTSTTRRPLGDFLKSASEVLVDLKGRNQSTPPILSMPGSWPGIDAAQEQRILDLVVARLRGRLEAIAVSAGRFDEVTSQYRARAFVRVRRSDGCQPQLFWSDYGEPFKIAPWYDNNGTPPVKVQLPDPFDANFLKNLKPNVAFILPEGLFNLLQKNSPKDFLEGKAAAGGPQLALDWICSFNIPIITLCAFIVLNIFLSLFDLIFQWLLFIKICIPFPKRQ